MKIKLTQKTLNLRIEIAKDIVERIKNGEIIPSSGASFGEPDRYALENKTFDYFRIAPNKNFLTKNNPCLACAKGSLMLSFLNKNNGIPLPDLITIHNEGETETNKVIIEKLSGIFSEEEINEIEILFEQDPDYKWLVLPYEKRWTLYEFSLDKLSNDSKKRLVQIMKLIIKNKGKFIVL